MDPGKKRALIDWVNAIDEEANLNSLHDLKDGKQLINLLKLSDLTTTPNGDKSWMQNVQEYVENFFQIDFSQNKLIDFDLIYNSQDKNNPVEFELAKVLLAVLSTSVQGKNGHLFVCPAMNLDLTVQMSIKELLEGVLYTNDPQTMLPSDFADILTRSTVANTSRPSTPLCMTPNGEDQFFPSNISFNNTSLSESKPNSPLSRISGSLKDSISSPLRMLTLSSSPSTPLAEFMQSPQLAQKILLREKEQKDKEEAMMRQKEQDIKKLEMAISTERHLRQELELDLQDKSVIIDNKESKIRDLLKQLQQLRKMQDEADELVSLRAENERIENENFRLKNKLEDIATIRKQCEDVEKENKEILEELEKYREEMKMMESLKSGYDNYRTQCHKLQVTTATLEAKLDQSQTDYSRLQDENEAILKSLEQLKEINAKQKNEIEDHEAGGVCNGESMAVITDKKLVEVEAELEKIQHTWVHPDVYEELQDKHNRTLQERDEFETSIHQLNETNGNLEEEIAALKEDLGEKDHNIDILNQSNSDISSSLAALERKYETDTSELKTEITEVKKSHEETITKLETDYNSKLVSVEAKLTEESDHHNSLKLTHEQLVLENNNNLVVIETKQWEITELTRLQQESANEIRELREKIQQQTEQVSNLESQLVNETDKYNQLIESTTMRISELESLCELKSEEIMTLQQTTAEAIQSLEISKQNLAEELGNLQENTSIRIKQLELECQKRTQEFVGLEKASSAKIKDLQSECKTWCDANEQLTKSLSDTKTEMTRQFEHHNTVSEQLVRDKVAYYESEIIPKLTNEFHSVLAEQKQATEDATNKVAKLQNDLETQKQVFADFEQVTSSGNLESQKEISSLRASREVLETENESLGQELVRLQASSSVKIQELETDCENQKAQFEDLESKMAAKLDAIQTQCDEFNKEKHSLQTEIEKLISENHELQGVYEIQMGELSELKLSSSSKIGELEATCQKLMESKQQLESDQDILKTEFESQKQQSQDEIQTLQSRSEESKSSLESELENMKQVQLQKEFDFQQQVSKMAAQIEELEGTCQKLTESKEQLEQEFKTELDSQKLQSQDEVQKLRSHSEESKSSLESELENVKQIQQQKELDFLEITQAHQQQVAKMAAQIQELESKCQQQNLEYTQLSEISSEKIQELQSKCDHQEQLLMEEKMSTSARIHEIEAESEKLQTDNLDQKQQLMNMMALEEMMSAKMQELETEYDRHEQENQNQKLTKTIAELETECNKLSEVERELENVKKTWIHPEQYHNLQSQLQQTEQQHQLLQEEQQNLQQQLSVVQQSSSDRIAELEDDIQKMSNLNSEMKSEYETQSHLMESSSAKLSQLEEDLVSKSEQLHQTQAELHSKVEESKEQLQSMKKELESHEEISSQKISKLEHHCQELTDSNQSLEQSIQSKMAECEELKQMLGNAEARVEELLLEMNGVTAARDSNIQISSDAMKELECKLVDMENSREDLVKKHQQNLEETEQYWKLQLISLEEEFDKGIKEQKESYEKELQDQHERHENEISNIACQQEGVIVSQRAVLEDRIEDLEAKMDRQKSEWVKKLHQSKSDHESAMTGLEQQYQSEIESLKSEITEICQSHDDAASKMEADYQSKLSHLESCLQEQITTHQSLKSEIEEYKVKSQSESNENLSRKDAELKNIEEDYKSKLGHLQECLEEQLSVQKQMKTDIMENMTQMKNDYEQKLRMAETSRAEAISQLVEEHKSKQTHLEASLRDETSVHQELKDQVEIYTKKLVQTEAAVLERTAEFENHVSQLNKEKEDLKEKLKSAQLKEKELKEEISSLQTKVTELTSSEQQSSNMATELSELKSEMNRVHEECFRLTEEKKTLENNLTHSKGEFRAIIKAKESEFYEQTLSERQAYEEQMTKQQQEIHSLRNEYNTNKECYQQSMKNQVSKYQAECISLKQQLTAIEEEKACLEESNQRLTKSHEDEIQQLNNESEAEIRTLKVEKESLAAQLEIFQHRQELTQSTITELSQQIAINDSHKVHYEAACKDMEKKLNVLTRDGQKLKLDLEKSQKLNAKLEVTSREASSKLQEYVERELKLIKNHDKEMNQASEMNRKLRNQLEAAKQEVAVIENAGKETQKSLQSELEECYSQHQSSLSTLNNALDVQRQLAEKFRLRAEKVDLQLTKTAEDSSKFKSMNQKMRSLEVQLEHANRQVREYKHQLDTAGTALLGDGTAFKQEIEGHSDSLTDVSLNDSLESCNDTTVKTRHHNVSSTSSNNSNSSKSSFYLSDKENRRFSMLSLASTTSTCTIDSRKSGLGGSHMTLRSRSSDSHGSRQSLTVPHGTGNLFSCADEPFDDYEWNRLSELQRRNTLCLPHMRSAYPVETQSVALETIKDDALRESQNSDNSDSLTGRKRKPEKPEMELSMTESNKQARHGSTMYQKPGPPTPGARTNSKSPHKSKSPRTPRGRARKADKTPAKKTPIGTPKDKKKNSRDSIAFSIGFSPKTRFPKRLTRQTGFITKGENNAEGKQSPNKQKNHKYHR